jgi:hypothetical protein
MSGVTDDDHGEVIRLIRAHPPAQPSSTVIVAESALAA